jgi:hypothetical protein
MLGHIYSFCDVATLVALSLVSFGSWELAGPILYEQVEITSLDALKALFFLVSLTNLSISARVVTYPLESPS